MSHRHHHAPAMPERCQPDPRRPRMLASSPAFVCALALALACAIVLTFAGCAEMPASGASAAAAHEDIIVLRSQRVERTPKSTWCTAERAGFAPFNSEFLLDDRYTMWSVQVRPGDARVVDAKAAEVGSLRTCFGLTADPKVINFYAEGHVAGISLSGNGLCFLNRADYPEKGFTTYRCHLDLRGLGAPYVGGLLTTNSLVSKAVLSGESEPAGYVQTSIATLRLWR